jgi:hypothetical protein
MRVFENRVLRRVFGVTRECRKIHNEEPHNLYPSPNVIRVINSSRRRWVDM